ncbi:1-acyl-sn-glycerol-3-phosphate acyltransferase [uncultured Sulfitobacter sp.]|uniref:lysophospholipid acyltransferase family protein n=1 Tax=uncultured Sulfitobacter sp. TaxID=191468 RepID=UPI002602B86D|nr:1-acyl-sn-glycerol-3-phosphate acyltransferase [uncultured Sulfitobacter sp.]
MSTPWHAASYPPRPKLTGAAFVLVPMRALALSILVFGCLVLLLLIRAVERPVYGMARPITPHITRFVCRNALRILGLRLRQTGSPMTHNGAIVANHSSWLDIFTLNARQSFYFVSKSEVARWPGIGWLARATGTVFIERNPARARAQTLLFQERLMAGHRLLFFPEGTSTDGMQVLPFKTTLFEAFFAPQIKDDIWIQPVAVVYHPPARQDRRFYGWWGDMDFASHLLTTLMPVRQGSVETIFCAPVRVSGTAHRKDLAATCERSIREAHRAALDPTDRHR